MNRFHKVFQLVDTVELIKRTVGLEEHSRDEKNVMKKGKRDQ